MVNGPGPGAILRSHGLVLNKDVLKKSKSNGTADWDTSALLDVADPRRFQVSMRILDWNNDEGISFIVGIAPKDADVAMRDIEKHTGVFFNILDSIITKEGVSRFDVPGISSVWETGSSSSFSMFFEDGELFFEVQGHSRAKVPKDIPKADYRPCISICDPAVRLSVIVNPEVNSKRRREGDEVAALKYVKTLWEDRTFADATIVCGGCSSTRREIAVHRNILSVASPFFQKAFQGSMKESKDNQVVIQDATVESVEALLKFLYTGIVRRDTDVADLLPLAHRLQVNGLVEFCAEQLVKNADADCISSTIATLRPFRDDEVVRLYWQKLADKVSGNRCLVMALMSQ